MRSCISGASFAEFLEELLPAVEDALQERLPTANRGSARLSRGMRYSVFVGGKRVRPALVVLAGESYGARREDLLPGAAALEMIHTFSLIHDDLPALDDDDLRRGRPTLHREFDEALAILAGDALLNRGLLCLAEEPAAVGPARRAVAVEIAAAAVAGMLEGQAGDLEAEANWPENPEAALEGIHRRKTGALLTACLRLGGVYAGASAEDDRLLGEIGEGVGLLFQIGDDILDVVGETEALGKTAGKDADSKKLTYPGLFGIAESRRRLAEERDKTLELCVRLPRNRGLFASLVRYLCDRDR